MILARMLLLSGGRCIDPETGLDAICDVTIEGTQILSLWGFSGLRQLTHTCSGERIVGVARCGEGVDNVVEDVIDCRGCIVCPG